MSNKPTYAELTAALMKARHGLRLGSTINEQYEARLAARIVLDRIVHSDCIKPAAKSENEVLSTIDAHVWATDYCRLNPGADYGTMLAWFANSIMAGYDHAERKARESTST